MTPDPLKSGSQSSRPSGQLPTATTTPRRGGRRDGPSWFEAQDLHVIKAWNNEIIEIQPEISLFGSLKVIDVRISVFIQGHSVLIRFVASWKQASNIARIIFITECAYVSRPVTQRLDFVTVKVLCSPESRGAEYIP